jgi:hypothetical protein
MMITSTIIIYIRDCAGFVTFNCLLKKVSLSAMLMCSPLVLVGCHIVSASVSLYDVLIDMIHFQFLTEDAVLTTS